MSETKAEIQIYLDEVNETIKQTKDPVIVKNLVNYAKKKVVLKTLDSKVKKRHLKDYIGKQDDLLGVNEEEIKESVETLTNSMEEEGNYRVFLKTNLTSDKVKKTLSTFGTGIIIRDILDGKVNDYIEVLIPKTNLIGNEVLDTIEK